MKLHFASLAIALVASSSLQAVTLSQWTFETSKPTSGGPHVAELGEVLGQEATGVHSASATVFSNPVGNGSGESFSANNWNADDYWQFKVSTTGYQDISLSWDQTRSSTGPSLFDLAYSLDGVTFIVLVNDYTVDAVTWSSGSSSTLSEFSPPLNVGPALDDKSDVYFRIISQETVASGGTARIDNFTVIGSKIMDNSVSTPDAGSSILLLSLALGGVVGAYRRGVGKAIS